MNSLPGERNKQFFVFNLFTEREYVVASDNALHAVTRIASECSGHSYVMNEQTVWGSLTVALGDYVAFFDGRKIGK